MADQVEQLASAAEMERKRQAEAAALREQARPEREAANCLRREAAQQEAAERERLAAEAIEAGERKRLAQRASLSALRVQQVEWDEWVMVKTRWGKQREKRSHCAENCTLRFSGARVYIELPDGSELIKAISNVRYGEAIQ